MHFNHAFGVKVFLVNPFKEGYTEGVGCAMKLQICWLNYQSVVEKNDSAIRYNTELHWREYRLARNQVVHLIRKAKRDFYRNSINCNLDNPKNLWKIIRNLAPSQCSNLPSHLLVDGIIYYSHIDIANLFNAHFVNIASSVVLNKNTSTTPN